VNEKYRERLIAAVEKSMKTVGANDYTSGMEQARKLIAFFYQGMEHLKTPDDLRALLDMCSPMSKREEAIYLLLAQNLHPVIRLGLNSLAKRASSNLPAFNPGRPPALTEKETREALDYVWYAIRRGYSMQVAKLRAAQKYGCSLRTINRLWVRRRDFTGEASEPTIAL